MTVVAAYVVRFVLPLYLLLLALGALAVVIGIVVKLAQKTYLLSRLLGSTVSTPIPS